ncbi:MAG: ATP-dependent DNA helicase RecG [Clostridiaceae bacterium]|nr:ATP-dependent DNA helicase RecG [Clostridiaceae bacterium]
MTRLVQNDPSRGEDILRQPVASLSGVGARRVQQFERLGLSTIHDLVSFFPRAYEDWTSPLTVRDLAHGEDQAFVAEVARKPSLMRKGRFSMVRTVLRDETGAIAAVWFNQPYLAPRLAKGERYLFRGRIQRTATRFEVQNPGFEPYTPDSEAGVLPVYPLTRGLTQGVVRSTVAAALGRIEGKLPEPLPHWVRREHKLCDVDFAYRMIHQPSSVELYEVARRRLALEEMFVVQAGLRMIKGRLRGLSRGIPMPADPGVDRSLQAMAEALPFRLTGAQRRAVAEVRSDMAHPYPMNRMLQGDVGSGKTVVAAMALYHAVLNGCQGALMAPTSILAEQHAATLQTFFSGHNGLPALQIALLTGSTRAAQRRHILAGIADGGIQILVGTHALIEETVRFARLGLAVTDEQHRFGVRQRTTLTLGAHSDPAPEPEQQEQSMLPDPSAVEAEPPALPHVLVMSATPIPRSLGLMLYGDLDLSILDERPEGRTPVETYAATSADRDRIYRILRKQVEEGRQAYVVCPMIEESEEAGENRLESAVETHARLARDVFPDLSVALLHGGMKAAEKTAVMESFREGGVGILVTTTVIEVGVDNPNASVMVIENAERFGLAQLHQLRGRIGRGPYRSVCILVSDVEDGVAKERIRTLCRETDGFRIAEKDLELRGPGDFFGTRQHGIPDFRIANLYEDAALLREVSGCLDRLMEADPCLVSPENRALIPAIRTHFGESFPSIGL